MRGAGNCEAGRLVQVAIEMGVFATPLSRGLDCERNCVTRHTSGMCFRVLLSRCAMRFSGASVEGVIT